MIKKSTMTDVTIEKTNKTPPLIFTFPITVRLLKVRGFQEVVSWHHSMTSWKILFEIIWPVITSHWNKKFFDIKKIEHIPKLSEHAWGFKAMRKSMLVRKVSKSDQSAISNCSFSLNDIISSNNKILWKSVYFCDM